MPYWNVTPHAMFQSCINDTSWKNMEPNLKKACAWVQAVNTYDIHELHSEIFNALESGEAEKWSPDADWSPSLPPEEKLVPTQELADLYIEELIADYELEKRRFPDGNGPGFERLTGPARFYVAQRAYDIQMTIRQIVTEAERRLANGEVLPPREDAQIKEVLSRPGTPPP